MNFVVIVFAVLSGVVLGALGIYALVLSSKKNKEAEAKLLDAIAPADSISKTEGHVSEIDIYRGKHLMWFYLEHGRKKEARELLRELKELIKEEPSVPIKEIEEMADMLGVKPEEVSGLMEKQKELGYPFFTEDELKALLE